jgi:beta-glucanase (GH16 family)
VPTPRHTPSQPQQPDHHPPPALAQLTNQPQGKPHLPDEIDLEFVNAGRLFTEPNAFWTNVWASPNQHSIRKHNLYSSQIAPMIGDPSFTTTSAMHTYLVDWQPGFIRWYIKGVLVDQLTISQGTIPSHPMYASPRVR